MLRCQNQGSHRSRDIFSLHVCGKCSGSPCVPRSLRSCIQACGITGAVVLARTNTRQVTDLSSYSFSYCMMISSSVGLLGSILPVPWFSPESLQWRSMIASGAPVPHVQCAIFDGRCNNALGITGAFVPARDASVRRRIWVMLLLRSYAAAVSVSDQRNASPVSHI
jgi:hypothetical protein